MAVVKPFLFLRINNVVWRGDYILDGAHESLVVQHALKRKDL
jgi:hypothetical protein